jgi:hypothetical protein
MNKLAALTLLLAAAGAHSNLQAQNVWRCGADGRSFSDRPCAEGQRLQMAELADTRSTSEVLAAREVAARQQRLAETLRQERLQREREAETLPGPQVARPSRHGGAGFKPKREAKMQQEQAPRPPRRQAQRPSAPRPPAADGIWRAVAPASRRTKD